MFSGVSRGPTGPRDSAPIAIGESDRECIAGELLSKQRYLQLPHLFEKHLLIKKSHEYVPDYAISINKEMLRQGKDGILVGESSLGIY